MQSEKRILYLEGRPHAHIMHRKFAMSVCDNVMFIDEKARWQDLNLSPVNRMIAWFRNAKYLSRIAGEYDAILVDNLHFTPVLLRLFLKRSGKKLPIIVHLGSHTLYFMRSGRFGTFNNWLHKQALSRYSAAICEGNMAREFLEEILPPNKRPKTYVTFLGPPSHRHDALIKITPKLEGNYILLIANGPGEFRMFYKGLDLMINAFNLALKSMPSLNLVVLGDWDPEIITRVMSDFPKEHSGRVLFEGAAAAIDPYIESSALCIHCTRGDAFPTSTIEAMTAGLPTLISEVTGTKEIVEKVDRKFITRIDEKDIADKIIKYFHLSNAERRRYSALFRAEAIKYNEEAAVECYRDTFREIMMDLEIL